MHGTTTTIAIILLHGVECINEENCNIRPLLYASASMIMIRIVVSKVC